MCMDDEGGQSRRRQRRRPAAATLDAEDPPLFPGGSARGSSSTQSAPPAALQDGSCDKRNALIEELGSFCEVDRREVREENMTSMVKQLVRLHMESAGLGDDRASEAAVLAKLPRTGQSMPHRMFCECIVAALDELVSSNLHQEELLEQLIAVMNLETHEKQMGSPFKASEPLAQKPMTGVRVAEEIPPASSKVAFRWVRHELSAIQERGESTVSYEAFTELHPKVLASQEVATHQ
jgi:hypothetical protein